MPSTKYEINLTNIFIIKYSNINRVKEMVQEVWHVFNVTIIAVTLV